MEEVQAAILSACLPLPVVSVPLSEALASVAAEVVTAPADVPAWANSAMDGYALRAADTSHPPVRLHVAGLLPAGTAPDPDRPVARGEAIRIMTGAPMPPGADAVVMVEHTTAVEGGAAVQVEASVRPGENVREPGSDMRAGQEVVAAGTVLSPALLGVLASLGRAEAIVHRRAVVGILSTGDEVVDGPSPLRPGQIYDSNRPMLAALVREAACTPIDLGSAPDDAGAITRALDAALDRCDAVVVTGGVSMGDFDFVGSVLSALGPAREWRVAMKPGKPLAWGLPRGRPVFGLPGNPVSAAVSFELFARPALRRLLGHPRPLRTSLPAVAGEPFRRRRDGKLHLVRVVATVDPADARLHARSAGGQGSHMLAALASGNALALLPDGEGVAEGEPVDVYMLGPG